MEYTFEFSQDLNEQLPKRQLTGYAFTGDEDSVTLKVAVTRAGEPASLEGHTVVGYCIRPDGTTVDITGSFTENAACVTLTSECFEQQGRVDVVIRATETETGAKTPLLAAAMTVARAKTETEVSGGSIITDVSTLIAEIEAAEATIPPKYTAMQNGVAQTFSTSHAYRTGDYAWYDGVLYRFTQDHPAGSWDADQVDTVSVGQGVAEAFHALTMHNAANVLPSKADAVVASYNGTSYRIHNNVWTISGTTSANFSRNIVKQQTSLPWWLTPGRVLHVKLHKTGSMDGVRLCLYKYTGGTLAGTAFMDMSADGDFTVPSDFTADGMLARLYIASGKTISGTIEPEIFIGLPNADILTKIDTQDAALDADLTHYISAPGTTYSGMTLAQINDNVILNCNSGTFSDSPVSGIFINRRFNASYNVNLAIANGSGKMYTRIVKRSDHSVYRDWVQLAIQSDVDALPSADVALGRFSGKKIYCEGDSIMYGVTTYNGGRATQTIPQTLAKRLPSSCTVDNKAHGGDRIQHTGDTSTSISDSLIADTSVSGYDYFVINGGTNDYTGDVPIGAITDKANSVTNTFYYGLVNMVEHILTQNPLARIMLITPIFRNYCHSTLGNAYQLQNNAGATLGDYCDAMLAVGRKYCIPVYDSRDNAPFNEINYASTLHIRASGSQGYLHPTDAAYKVWGQSLASFFLANF